MQHTWLMELKTCPLFGAWLGVVGETLCQIRCSWDGGCQGGIVEAARDFKDTYTTGLIWRRDSMYGSITGEGYSLRVSSSSIKFICYCDPDHFLPLIGTCDIVMALVDTIHLGISPYCFMIRRSCSCNCPHLNMNCFSVSESFNFSIICTPCQFLFYWSRCYPRDPRSKS